VLRRWELADAEALAALLERSRDHYAEFIAFFLEGEPRERMQTNVAGWNAAMSWSYGAFESERLIGGGGLFPRIGPAALEIGYHVAVDETGRGLATEIAGAFVQAGFEVCGAERLEMHIHPRNLASIGVARKLGFVESGYDGDEMIFSRVRPSSESSVTSA
jgi:RimJ/RimL family protein N-acetyltransferase